MQSQKTNSRTPLSHLKTVAADDAGTYQTGRGCLVLSLMLLGAIAIAVVAIMLFGRPSA